MNQSGDSPQTAALPLPAELPADLHLLLEELPPGKAMRGVRQLETRLSAGDSIEAALAAARDLPAHLKRLIETAWRSPRTAGLLTQFVSVQRQTTQLRQEVSLAVAYPFLLLLGLWLMFIFFEHFFISPLSQIMVDFDTTASFPAPVVAIWLSSPLAVAISATLLAAVLSIAAVRLFVSPTFMDRWLNWLPVLGSIWRWHAVSNWCRVLALLVEAETPLPEALALTSQAVGGELSRAGRAAADRATAGESLSTAVARTWQFPRTLVPLVAWGEQNASLAEGLRTAAEMFEGRVRAHLNLLRTWLPPLCFVGAALSIWFLALAALMPIMRLLESML